jgi:hypothetical protein
MQSFSSNWFVSSVNFEVIVCGENVEEVKEEKEEEKEVGDISSVGE